MYPNQQGSGSMPMVDNMHYSNIMPNTYGHDSSHGLHSNLHVSNLNNMSEVSPNESNHRHPSHMHSITHPGSHPVTPHMNPINSPTLSPMASSGGYPMHPPHPHMHTPHNVHSSHSTLGHHGPQNVQNTPHNLHMHGHHTPHHNMHGIPHNSLHGQHSQSNQHNQHGMMPYQPSMQTIQSIQSTQPALTSLPTPLPASGSHSPMDCTTDYHGHQWETGNTGSGFPTPHIHRPPHNSSMSPMNPISSHPLQPMQQHSTHMQSAHHSHLPHPSHPHHPHSHESSHPTSHQLPLSSMHYTPIQHESMTHSLPEQHAPGDAQPTPIHIHTLQEVREIQSLQPIQATQPVKALHEDSNAHVLTACKIGYVPCPHCLPSTIDSSFEYPEGRNTSSVVQIFLELNCILRSSSTFSIQHHLYHRLHHIYMDYLNGNVSSDVLDLEYQKNIAIGMGYLIVDDDVDLPTSKYNVSKRFHQDIETIYYNQWEKIKNDTDSTDGDFLAILGSKSSTIGDVYLEYFKECYDYLPPILKPLVKSATLNIRSIDDSEKNATILNMYTQVFREASMLVTNPTIQSFMNRIADFEDVYGELAASHLIHCHEIISTIYYLSRSMISTNDAMHMLNVAAGYLKEVSKLPTLMTNSQVGVLLVQQMAFAYFDRMKIPPLYIMDHFESKMIEIQNPTKVFQLKRSSSPPHLRPFAIENPVLTELPSFYYDKRYRNMES